MQIKERRNKKRNPYRKQETKFINQDPNIAEIKQICKEFHENYSKKFMRESMEDFPCVTPTKEEQALGLTKSVEQTKIEKERSKPIDFDSSHLKNNSRTPPAEVLQDARLSLGPDEPPQTTEPSIRGCEFCLEETEQTDLYETRKQLKDHEWQIHQKVRCPTCGKAYSKKNQAQRCHGKKPENLKGQLCDGCGKRFTDQGEYRKHKNRRTGKPCGLICKIDGCQHIEKTLWDMDLHKTQVHGDSKPKKMKFIKVSAGSQIKCIKGVQPAQVMEVMSKKDISKDLDPQFKQNGTPEHNLFMLARGDTVQALIEYSIKADNEASEATIHAIRSAKLHQEDVPHLIKEFFKWIQLKRATKVLLSFKKQVKDYFQWMGFHISGLKSDKRSSVRRKVKGAYLIDAMALMDNCLKDYTPKMEYSDKLPQCSLADELEKTLAKLRGLNFEQLVVTEMAGEMDKYLDEVSWAEKKDSWSTPEELIEYIAEKLYVHKSWLKDLTPMRVDWNVVDNYNALQGEWFDTINFTNPPYTEIECFLKKAMDVFINHNRSVVLLKPHQNCENNNYITDFVAKLGTVKRLPGIPFEGAFREFGRSLALVILQTPDHLRYKKWLSDKWHNKAGALSFIGQRDFRVAVDMEDLVKEKACHMLFQGHSIRNLMKCLNIGYKKAADIFDDTYPQWREQQGLEALK